MAQVATARMSMSALFGSVTAAASTVTTTLTALGDAAQALGYHSAQWAENTRLTCKADQESFVTELVVRKATEQAQMNIEVNKFRNQSEEHATSFDAAHAKFTALLRK